MRGLRKVSKPSRGRRFPHTADAKALEDTRAKPCLLRGRKCWVNSWRGVYPNVEVVSERYEHVCGGTVQAHHVQTKARGGADTPENLWPLCSVAHAELHSIGQAAFATRWSLSPHQNKGDPTP